MKDVNDKRGVEWDNDYGCNQVMAKNNNAVASRKKMREKPKYESYRVFIHNYKLQGERGLSLKRRERNPDFGYVSLNLKPN